jgi:hypothetical protein
LSIKSSSEVDADMLLAKIQADLFNFTEQDPEDFAGLVEFWYQANSAALSAALTSHSGLNLILNVTSFRNFEALAKRLFLVADALILRDVQRWATTRGDLRFIPLPTGKYEPGFLRDSLEELQKLRPSPLTLSQRPNFLWTSEAKTLNNGLHVAYAGLTHPPIPSEFLDWMRGSGREYMKTGQVIYAPSFPHWKWSLSF